MLTLVFFALSAQAADDTSRLLRGALRQTDLNKARRRKIAGPISGEIIEASEMEQEPEGLLKSAGTAEVHFSPNCELGYGYDIWLQECFAAPAIKIPKTCTEDDDSYVNCLDTNTLASGGWTSYNMKTTSSDDYSNLISTAVSAEGAGWGVSASASVDYMKSNAVTSNSVGFWIGLSGDVYNSFLRNPTELELNDAAKIVLATDWKSFISLYGTHYVKQIVHSTNFIGSAQISSRSESSSSELSVAAEMSYKGFFSASASAEYTEATQGKSNSLKIHVKSKYRGELIDYDDNDDFTAAQQLAADFQEWRDQVGDDPEGNSVPTRLVYRTLYDLAEVQKIVVENYPAEDWVEISNAFQTGLPTPTTIVAISEEAVWAKAQMNTLNLFREYQCVLNNDALLLAVNTQNNVLTTHLVELESMDGADIMLRETEILAGDFSWFYGRDMTLTKEIEDQLAECPIDMCECLHPGSITKNDILCSESGKMACDVSEVCYGETPVAREDWDQLCTSDYCRCDLGSYPMTPLEDWNERRIACNEQPWRECKSSKTCVYTGFWKYGQWDHLCF